MATNKTINGIDYFRIKRKVGTKLNKKGKIVPDEKYFYGKSKTDAENQYKTHMKNKAERKSDNRFFKDTADYFVYHVFINDIKYASGTRELYERAYRLYISKDEIMAKMLPDVGSKDIQNLLNAMTELEIPLKKGGVRKVGQGSIKAAKNLLVLFFKYCEIEGYCKNYMPNVTLPEVSDVKPPNNDVDVWTEEEVDKIVEGVEFDRMRFLYLLSIGTGIREGELLILRDTDFTTEGVKITTQLVTRNKMISAERFREEDTKTSNSVRVVPLPEELRDGLERHRREHKKEMEVNGYQTDFVFTTETGNFIDRRNLRRAHQRMLKRVGVGYKKFHTFRGTYATMLCKRGVPIQTAAELMGDDIKTVAKYYLFVTSQEKQDAVNVLNDIFSKKEPKPQPVQGGNLSVPDFDSGNKVVSFLRVIK